MLAAAHAFQTFGGLAPCELCLKQRTVYWVAGAFAAIAMVVVRLPGGPRFREASCWLLALIFLASVGVAGYHAGVEWKFWPGPESCSGVGKVTAASLRELMNGGGVKMPACDRPAWVMGGLSMAGWNALASVVWVALSVAAALRERSKT
jgi:disulfide bond formation protein DsbB